MITKTLLTFATCGPCHMLKNKLSKIEGLVYEVKDYSIPDEREIFGKYNINSVPRLVIERDDGSFEIIQGMDDIIKRIKED